MALNAKSLLSPKSLAKGISPQQAVVEAGLKPLKQIGKMSAVGLAALGLYFMKLGAAAFKGFVIGATVGGAVGAGYGAFMGLQIALATGPFAPLVAPITVPLGAFVGGSTGALVGGLAGGLIAAGLASGSATMVAMGVGAGVGGAVGAYAGGIAGATIGTTIVAVCAIATGGTCVLLAPIIPIMTFTGAAIGAVIGAVVGGAIGYVVGNYIITPVTAVASESGKIAAGGASEAGGLASTAGGAVASAISGIGGFLAGAASTIGGLVSSGAGGLWGGITAATNFTVNGLSAAATTVANSAAVGTVTAGTVATVGTVGVLTQINTATSFFSPQNDRVFESTPGAQPGSIGGPTDPNCPYGWPTEHGWINQGPNGTVSHQGIQAIDIHGNARGTPVYATHPGTAHPSIRSNNSKDIEIVGVCDGQPFSSFTTHFLSFDVVDDQVVSRGTLIGRVDCTGTCGSDHVHYQFGWPNIFYLPMAPPYIPETVPEGCVGRTACGNIEW